MAVPQRIELIYLFLVTFWPLSAHNAHRAHTSRQTLSTKKVNNNSLDNHAKAKLSEVCERETRVRAHSSHLIYLFIIRSFVRMPIQFSRFFFRFRLIKHRNDLIIHFIDAAPFDALRRKSASVGVSERNEEIPFVQRCVRRSIPINQFFHSAN